MKPPTIEPGLPEATSKAFDKLEMLAMVPARTDSPASLAMDAIVREPALFQPRFNGVLLAPGRSEAHIAKLAKEAKAGRPLDPVTIVAFSDRWYLVDGHHRLEAYRQAGWTGDVPISVRHSDRLGAERVEWAIGLSVDDNSKDRLSLTDEDRLLRAWQAVARQANGSKSDLAERFRVSERTIANMRSHRRKLEEAGKDLGHIPTWTRAQGEVRNLDRDYDWSGDSDRDERTRRELARRLKPVMDVRARPMLLLEALEAYEPHILAELVAARDARNALIALYGDDHSGGAEI